MSVKEVTSSVVLATGTSGFGSTGRGTKILDKVKTGVEMVVLLGLPGAKIFYGRIEGGGESDCDLFFVLRRGLANWLPSS